MGKLVVLKLGKGSLETGLSVTLQIGEEQMLPFAEVTGELPPSPELLQQFEQWQSIYRRLDLSGRPMGLPKPSQPATPVACQQAADVLRDRLNTWLRSPSFRPIREKWLEKLLPTESIRLILQTQNLRLQQLPWHLWEVLERYPAAELALSAPIYEQVNPTDTPAATVQVLALLGDSTGIDIQRDRTVLEQLPDATVRFLVEPDRKDLTDQLWEHPWDILFFAGHSATSINSTEGVIAINSTDSLTLTQLKYALKKAVARGLKLAIFNSCDGLGLAREFADLQIPQLIVMREPVPDRVAQEFLKYFLEAYANGALLYLAVRTARERLQALEDRFPCATWLPILHQNLAEVPPTWEDLRETPVILEAADARTPTRSVRSTGWAIAKNILLTGATTAAVILVRSLGLLQPLELQAFDELLRWQPDEPPDNRLLVVTITEADVQAQPQESRRGSLSDATLLQLLEKLEAHKPRVIGLDIYRDYPVLPAFPALAERLQRPKDATGRDNPLVAVCRVSDPQSQRPGVDPPPEVSSDRLGFSDLVLDPDNIVRRQLLSLTPPPASPCTASYSFNAQLALRYLFTQNITLQLTPTGRWQLGKASFVPLESRTGGYQGIDAWGSQILLRYRTYRSPREIAPQVTLEEILSDRIDPNLIRDRIVLIGTTAESFQDYSLTPYQTPQRTVQRIPGVILQAQMVSQLVSAAMDGRSLLWAGNFWQDGLWIWLWAAVGTVLSLAARSWVRWLVLAGAIAALTGVCWLVFVFWSGWLPLVPAIIVLMEIYLIRLILFQTYATQSSLKE